MDVKESMWFRIYDFLLMRIRLGYYRPGAQLLIKPICDLFEISNSPVRCALELLEQRGYVSFSGKRGVRVIWDASNPEPLPDDLFIDSDTMIDIHKSYGLLQPEILWQGLRLANPQELDKIATMPIHLAANEFIVYLIKGITKQLGNPLMLELHRDITLFTEPTTLRYFLNFPDIDQSRFKSLYNEFQQTIDQCKYHKYEQVYNQVKEIYGQFGKMPVYVNTETIHPPARAFHWGSSSVGAEISSRLVTKISVGTYPARTYLPSVEALAKEYSVSRMTVRRTIWLLNSMGITQTVNGVGTRVLALRGNAEHIKWDNQNLQKTLMQFLYTLQFLLVTCRRVTEATFCGISKDTMQCMAGEIEEGVADEMYYIALGVWVKQIIQSTDLAGIREIYRRLLSQLVWGIPLRFADGYKWYPERIEKLLCALKLGDKVTFIHELEHCCMEAFVDCRDKLIQLGIEGAERVAVPIVVPF